MSVPIDRKREMELESALCDAALMAAMTTEFIGRALHFDERKPPKLCREEADLLSFAVLQTRMSIDKAKAIFYGEEAS